MNILYLHGLESKLSPEKRLILEKFGNIIAPDLDYKSNPNIIQNLYAEFKNQSINAIIGSSMGGFAGYYLANCIGVRAMLYNPALPYRTSIEQFVPEIVAKNPLADLRIVLGGLDNVIMAKDNLTFFAENYDFERNYQIVIRKELGHQIPIAVFEEETNAFFENNGKNRINIIKT